jgi:Zn-dependent M32 family carboxypeptidase
MCRDILGIAPHLLWGTNDNKNTSTNLKWEDIPTKTSKQGYMTVREVLEYVGTDLFRKMYQNVWSDALMRKIKNDNSMFAIITDARFENEFETIQNNGGKVLKLTRGIAGEKNDVDKYNNYDYIIDNKDLTIPQQNAEIDKILKEIRLHNLFGIKNEYN